MKCPPALWCCLVFAVLASCKKAYQPPAITAVNSYLVVEGVISSGADSTIIKLSNTVDIASKTTANPVRGATLTVEGNQGNTYALIETRPGTYASPGLNLDNTAKYRLHITTSGNKEYLSDYVSVVNSPAIDTLSYSIQSDGIQFSVSTHDPQNNTHYYRWDYQETWVIHSKYYSFYVSTGDTVIERDLVNNQVYQCWQSDTSSTVVLASSALLAKDVADNVALNFVPAASPKLDGVQSILATQYAPSTHIYSILVRQFGLTGDAYTFWANLKKNTENLGSIFDAQPSQVGSNIHSVSNPAEAVIGYLSAGSYSTKRVFLSAQQIPVAWLPNNINAGCVLDSVYLSATPPGSAVVVNEENEYFNLGKSAQYFQLQIPIAALFDPITDAPYRPHRILAPMHRLHTAWYQPSAGFLAVGGMATKHLCNQINRPKSVIQITARNNNGLKLMIFTVD